MVVALKKERKWFPEQSPAEHFQRLNARKDACL